MCVLAHMCVASHEDQKKASNLLESQDTVSHLM